MSNRILAHNVESNEILRESLRIAILELMKNKKFSEITISELCQKAGVSRTGFYRNYSDKKDVITEVSEDFFNLICNKVGRYFNHENHLEWYRDYFNFIKENETMIKTMYDAGFQAEHLIETTKLLIERDGLTEKQKSEMIMFNGALHNITLYWLFKDKKTPVDEISNWCCEYLG